MKFFFGVLGSSIAVNKRADLIKQIGEVWIFLDDLIGYANR